jgi:hypothetical protein
MSVAGIALAFLVAAAPSAAMAQAPAGAGTRAGGVTHVVHFSVPPILKMRTVREPGQLRVTERDVAAGFVSLDEGVEMEILTNLRGGYGVQFQLRHPVVRGVEVSGLGAPVRVEGAVSTVSFPENASRPGRRTLMLGFRLRLADHVAPGVYAWPVDMVLVRG